MVLILIGIGSYLGEADFCVNGFSFWINIEKTSDVYFWDLQRGPEIIENIGRFIGKDLWREYQELSKYYGVVFKMPVENVIFDGRDNVNTKEEKVRCLIKYALFYLNDFYNGCIGGNIFYKHPVLLFEFHHENVWDRLLRNYRDDS